MAMELVMNEYTLASALTFNYEELKAEITKRADHYKGVTYTDDQVNDARTDLADIRRFKKTLSGEKSRMKKEFLKPFEDFENKINELVLIIERSESEIDVQVKRFEEDRKSKKKEQILDIFYSFVERPEWLTENMVFNDRWLNKTYKLSEIKEELRDKIETANKEIATLEALPEFGFEAAQMYKKTMSMPLAIAEAKKMAEIQKQKQEALKRAEEAKRMAELPKQEPEFEPMTQEEAEVKAEAIKKQIDEALDAPERKWVAFKAFITKDEAKLLANFFKQNSIKITRG